MKLLYLLISIFTISSCNAETNNAPVNIKVENFEEVASASDSIITINFKGDGKYSKGFFYLDELDGGNQFLIKPKETVTNVIFSKVPIMLNYAVIPNTVPFIIYPGDSILISFNESTLGLPIAKHFKNTSNHQYPNFFSFQSESNYSFVDYQYPWNSKKVSARQKEQMYLNNINTLDSLNHLSLISKAEYSDFKNLLCAIDLTQKIGANTLLCIKNRKKYDSLKAVYKVAVESVVKFDNKVVFPNTKNLISIYVRFINCININKANEFASYYDSSSNIENPIVKNYALFYAIRGIQNKNKNYFEKYLNKFKHDCTDKTYLEYFNESVSQSTSKKNTYLFDINNKGGYNLDSLIKSKDKIVILDFWASWCGPCIEEVPALKKLKEEYTNKISFISISIDKAFLLWKKSIKNQSVESFENYLFPNGAGVIFQSKVYKIPSIPRYMIFNKGVLISDDCARPSSVELKTLIDKLLQSK